MITTVENIRKLTEKLEKKGVRFITNDQSLIKDNISIFADNDDFELLFKVLGKFQIETTIILNLDLVSPRNHAGLQEKVNKVAQEAPLTVDFQIFSESELLLKAFS
jgi:hypothetical protein